MRGPQERCRTVPGPDVHIRPLSQKRAHLLRVLIFHGVDEPEILVRGGADHHQQRQQERAQNARSIAAV
jgi:hypothetical protein